ncbi:hypothetical protein EJB05_31361, partial [Eragrostis curvula]
MAGLLPIALLVSLLAAGAAASGYDSSPPPPPHSPPPPPPNSAQPPKSSYPSPPPPAGDKDDDNKRIKLRVEGLVVCQSCAKRGSQSLDGAAPLQGAKVIVTCRDQKNRVMAWRKAAADENGYFLAKFGVEHLCDYYKSDPLKACFVRLLSSPDPKCNGVTNINGGLVGAPLRDEGKKWTGGEGYQNVAYSVGPLAFKPNKCVPTRPY